MVRRIPEEDSDDESVFSASESEDEERPSPRHATSRSGGADGGSALRPIASHTPMEIVAAGIGAASVGTSVAAMIIQPVNIVFVAGGLSCVIGPYAYWQQRRLTDVIALQETHKALSEQVDRLGKENKRLHETVVELSDTVDRLEDVEQALDVITQTQGQSIAAFEEQVKDNKEILAKMQSNLKANVLQNLLQVVIRSDKDENMTIEEHEIGDLINRIKRINGVEVHEDKLRERITKSGGSLQCVMDIIRNLMSDECPECDQIFTIKE